jgi:tRNA G18 (ribose-2'-O)-methylase SpoU
MKVHEVKSLNFPKLRPYQTLRQSAEHARNGIFVAEGEKVVRRLLESNFEIVSALLTPGWLDQLKSLLEPHDVDVFVADKKLVESIVGYHLHQGVMAVGKIPRPTTLIDLLAKTRPYLFVAVDGLTNSENLGVLVRNCAAFGVQGLFVGETSSSPYLRRAVRNSMGAIFQLPVVFCTSLANTIEELQSREIRVLAAHPHGQEQTLWNADLKNDCCIVFGSEGSGISKEILECCDRRIAIPMQSGVDSLNVASASAVFLFEVVKQRERI